MNARRSLRTALLRVWKQLPLQWQLRLIWLGSSRVSYGAGAVILNEHGHVLLVHHLYRGGSGWGLPGGLSAAGEQPASTVLRELREELGARATLEQLLRAQLEPRGRHLSMTYLARLADEPRPDGIEIDGYRYVDPADLPDLIGRRAAAYLHDTLRMVAPTHNPR